MVTECFNSQSTSANGVQLPRVPPTKQTYEQGIGSKTADQGWTAMR